MRLADVRRHIESGAPLAGGAVVVSDLGTRPNGPRHSVRVLLVRCLCGSLVEARMACLHDGWTCVACSKLAGRGRVAAGALDVLRFELWLAERGYTDVRRAPEGQHPDVVIATRGGFVGVEVRAAANVQVSTPKRKPSDTCELYVVMDGAEPTFWRRTGVSSCGYPEVGRVVGDPLPPPAGTEAPVAEVSP